MGKTNWTDDPVRDHIEYVIAKHINEMREAINKIETGENPISLAHSQTTGQTPTDHHSNANDPSGNQKLALDASENPSNTNPFLTLSAGDGRYMSGVIAKDLDMHGFSLLNVGGIVSNDSEFTISDPSGAYTLSQLFWNPEAQSHLDMHSFSIFNIGDAALLADGEISWYTGTTPVEGAKVYHRNGQLYFYDQINGEQSLSDVIGGHQDLDETLAFGDVATGKDLRIMETVTKPAFLVDLLTHAVQVGSALQNFNIELYGNLNLHSDITGAVKLNGHTIPGGANTLALLSDLSAYLPITGGSISGNLIVSGDLTVSGITTFVDTENVRSKDKNIELNYDGAGGLIPDGGGITLLRAAGDDASVVWDEAVGKWKVGLVGSELAIATISDIHTQNTDIGTTSEGFTVNTSDIGSLPGGAVFGGTGSGRGLFLISNQADTISGGPGQVGGVVGITPGSGGTVYLQHYGATAGTKSLASLGYSSSDQDYNSFGVQLWNIAGATMREALRVYSSGKIEVGPVGWKGSIDPTGLTGNRSYLLPDKSGTFALMSDITGGSLDETLGIGDKAYQKSMTLFNDGAPGAEIAFQVDQINKKVTIGSGPQNYSLEMYGDLNFHSKITNASSIGIITPDGHNLPSLSIAQNDVTNNPSALSITNTGTGSDVYGTSGNWSVSKDGAAIFKNSVSVYNATFKGMILGGTYTADRTYTLPDVTGTVALNETVLGKFYTVARVCYPVNYDPANPGTTIDGVTLNDGDRVLLLSAINPAGGSGNGPWVFHGAGVPMTRPPEFATGDRFYSGTNIAVQYGTVYANTVFTIMTSGIIGTNNVVIQNTGIDYSKLVRKIGDTMTGNLLLTGSAPIISLTCSGTPGASLQLRTSYPTNIFDQCATAIFKGYANPPFDSLVAPYCSLAWEDEIVCINSEVQYLKLLGTSNRAGAFGYSSLFPAINGADWTICCWEARHSSGSGGPLLGIVQDNGFGIKYYQGIMASDIKFYYINASGTPKVGYATTDEFRELQTASSNVNKGIFIAARYIYSEDKLQYSFNGSPWKDATGVVTQDNTNTGSTSGSPTYPDFPGYLEGVVSCSWNGYDANYNHSIYISAGTIFTKSLSQSELESLYNRGHGASFATITGLGPAAWYKCNEPGTVTQLNDSSGNNYHLIVNGSYTFTSTAVSGYTRKNYIFNRVKDSVYESRFDLGNDFADFYLRAERMNFRSKGTVIFTIGPDEITSLVGMRSGSYIAGAELSADPDDPVEGSFVMWQSDGSDSGDDGDIMVKITAGAITKTTTLVDFSAV